VLFHDKKFKGLKINMGQRYGGRPQCMCGVKKKPPPFLPLRVRYIVRYIFGFMGSFVYVFEPMNLKFIILN
jgi:hypothetical protein